jgi:hypothetical protein
MERAAKTAAAGGHDEQALEMLDCGWGTAYQIEHYSGVDPEEWVAIRLDGQGSPLRAPAADGLRKLIEADYAANPVSRDVCP